MIEEKTNKITQYLPSFMDIAPIVVEFNTLEELLAIPFVHDFSITEDYSDKNFIGYGFAPYQQLLVARYILSDTGTKALDLIGFLASDIIGLPIFPEYEVNCFE